MRDVLSLWEIRAVRDDQLWRSDELPIACQLNIGYRSGETVRRLFRIGTMSKFREWLAPAANLAVVASIVFLAIQMRHNTRAIEAQTRDSITAKEMEYYGWMATNRDLAEVVTIAFNEGVDSLDDIQLRMWTGFAVAAIREWENSHYQYRLGLFTAEEYEGRANNMRALMTKAAWRWVWKNEREKFSAAFRADLDAIAAEGGRE